MIEEFRTQLSIVAEGHGILLRKIEETKTLLLDETQWIRRETKADLAELRAEFKTELAGLGTELRAEMADMKTELRTEMADMKTELRTEAKADKEEIIIELRRIDRSATVL